MVSTISGLWWAEVLRNLNALLPSGNRCLGSPFVGLPAEEILSTAADGDFGAGIFANDSISTGTRYRCMVVASTFPAGALTLFENGSGQFTAPGSATVRVLQNNLNIGTTQLQGVLGAAPPSPLVLGAAGCDLASSSPSALMQLGPTGEGGVVQWLLGRSRVFKVPYDPNQKTFVFTEKLPGEVIHLLADFSNISAGLSNPQVSVSAVSGLLDTSPQVILDGAPDVIDGVAVRQRITGGLAGANYTLVFTADGPNGQRLSLAGVLPVRAA